MLLPSCFVQVTGCFEELSEQVELLLVEILSKAGNQSSLNIKRAEENLNLAGQYFDNADRHEADVRSETEELRKIYEDHLLDYGRSEVKVNDTCRALHCEVSKYSGGHTRWLAQPSSFLFNFSPKFSFGLKISLIVQNVDLFPLNFR